MRGPPPPPPYFPDELSALQAEYSQTRGAAQRAVKRQIDALLAHQAAATAPPPEQVAAPSMRQQPADTFQRAGGSPGQQGAHAGEDTRWNELADQDTPWNELEALEAELTHAQGARKRAIERELQELELELEEVVDARAARSTQVEALEAELSQAKAASKAAVKDVVKSTQRVLAARVKALEDAVEGKGAEAERLAKENAALQAELRAAEGMLRAANADGTIAGAERGHQDEVAAAAAAPFAAPPSPVTRDDGEAGDDAARDDATLDDAAAREEAAKRAWLAGSNPTTPTTWSPGGPGDAAPY